MDTERINGIEPDIGRSHDAGIVFGSTAAEFAPTRGSVRAICEAIGLPRSTFYYQSHRSHSALELEQKIVLRLHELRDSNPNDGYRRMTRQLQDEGFHVNRKRIARLIQLHGLTTKSAKVRSGTARDQQPSAVVTTLRATGRPTRPHQAWVSDIAYVHIGSGLVYAAAVIDAWSREVVGYALSHQINRHLVSFALHSAIRARRPAFGCIHHWTSGTQYLMRGYRELLRQYGLASSVDVVSQPVPAGSGTSRSSRIVEMQEYETWEDVIQQPRQFVRDVYSRERIDAIVDRLSPTDGRLQILHQPQRIVDRRMRIATGYGIADPK